MMSKGVLRMSTHENPFVPGSLNRAIPLRGYPHSLASVSEEEKGSVTCEEEGEREFLDHLTQNTVDKILADIALEEPKEQPNTDHDDKNNKKKPEKASEDQKETRSPS